MKAIKKFVKGAAEKFSQFRNKIFNNKPSRVEASIAQEGRDRAQSSEPPTRKRLNAYRPKRIPADRKRRRIMRKRSQRINRLKRNPPAEHRYIFA